MNAKEKREKIIREHFSNMGKKGGAATKRNHPPEHFVELGKKGYAAAHKKEKK